MVKVHGSFLSRKEGRTETCERPGQAHNLAPLQTDIL
jgi:hypothetical protein